MQIYQDVNVSFDVWASVLGRLHSGFLCIKADSKYWMASQRQQCMYLHVFLQFEAPPATLPESNLKHLIGKHPVKSTISKVCDAEVLLKAPLHTCKVGEKNETCKNHITMALDSTRLILPPLQYLKRAQWPTSIPFQGPRDWTPFPPNFFSNGRQHGNYWYPTFK